MSKNKLLLTTCLCLSASAALAETGGEKIQSLINSLTVIDNRLQLSVTLGTGAVGYAEVGGVIVDGALDGAKVTEAMLLAYQDAYASVMAHDYDTAQTAEQMFTQEYTAAMNNLTIAVDVLADATTIMMVATSVADAAADADTRPEQAALQDMLGEDQYQVTEEKVDAYNEALDAVEGYAQQAGAFLAAANDTSLTTSIDSYAQQNGFVIGSYTALTYTQAVDEFVITWNESGYGTGWSGYLTDDMKDADDVFGAGVYIMQYGSAVEGM